MSYINITKIYNDVNRFIEQESNLKSWPSPLREEALYGLAGEFVNLVLPHTEADPAAFLTHFLAMFGSVVGRTPYFQVEGTRHYPRLNVCLAGDTANSRKGTSYDHVENRRCASPKEYGPKDPEGLMALLAGDGEKNREK